MKPKNISPKLITLFVFLSIIIGVTAVGFKLYNDNLNANLSAVIEDNLYEVLQHQKFNFLAELNVEKQSVASMAAILSHTGLSEEGFLEVAPDIVEVTNFEYLTLAFPDGRGIRNDGEIVSVGTKEHFQKALEGETFIAQPAHSSLRDSYIVSVSTPIIQDFEIVGVLIATYDALKLNNLFLASFDGAGYTYVTGKTGELIAYSYSPYSIATSSNFFSSLEASATFDDGMTMEKLLANIEKNKTDHVTYSVGGHRRIMYYEPLNVNGWYIFTVVPEFVVSERANSILSAAGIFTAVITAMFAACIIYILTTSTKIERLQVAHIDELSSIAYTDDLTGARTLAKFKIDAAQLARQNPDSPFVFIKLDVDKFKVINELFGFTEGDRVLKNIAKAINSVIISDYDIFARVGVDEFLIMLKGVSASQLDGIRALFEKNFLDMMGEDFTFRVRFLEGRYYGQCGESDIDDIFEKVNYAHKMAKSSGEIACEYDDKLKNQVLREKELETLMEEALRNEEFKIYLQPKYRLFDERIAGAEALVRWMPEGKPPIFPSDFIPLFEKNGFIKELDMYMLELTCKVIKGWMDHGIEPVTVSVNFSRRHLNNDDFIRDICHIADKYGVSRKLIEVELTESIFFDNENLLSQMLDRLHSEGFTLSMDDFGTGYSSLGLLKNLPVDVLKIDRSFFVNNKDERRAVMVISSVMEMAKKLNMRTVAEGVETREQVDFLRDLGCDLVQGYYFSRPVPAEQIANELINHSDSREGL